MSQGYPEDFSGFRTPVKELPPSLSMGSSSSPYFESSSPAVETQRFPGWMSASSQYGPSMHQMYPHAKQSRRFASSSEFLASEHDGMEINPLGSSPPIAPRFSRQPSGLATGSPRVQVAQSAPQAQRILQKTPQRPAKRGRPRKYPIKEDEESPVYASLPQQPQFVRTPRKKQKSSENLAEGRAPSLGLQQTTKFAPQGRGMSIAVTPPSLVNRQKGVVPANITPPMSANTFRMACSMQGAKKRAHLREFFLESNESDGQQFTTKGLGFHFTVDSGGAVSIDKAKAEKSAQRDPSVRAEAKLEPPQIVDVLEEEESDSESDLEYEVRTPPRFSSLGNSDAATEFARTFGRSHDRGFMFLFPEEDTPHGSALPRSNNPSTPKTPRLSVPFDEDSFSLQIQTPPGAVFSSYDYQAGNYVTGMTPYINGLKTNHE